MEKITVINNSKSPVKLITGEELQPKETVELEMQTYRENQPWINGSPVQPVQVDKQTGFGTARQVKGSATKKD